jgi:enolase
MRISDLRLRGILDSRARVTVEAELTLDGSHSGIGSAPRAIAPGRRERRRGPEVMLGPLNVPALCHLLDGRPVPDQRVLDALLTRAYEARTATADVTLAISLAFARAVCAATRTRLLAYLTGLVRSEPRLPRLMVNVFSGGIHLGRPARDFQQVMVIPATGTLTGDIRAASEVFAAAERMVRERFGGAELSASSGLLVPLGSERLLDLLDEAVAGTGLDAVCTVGVDVAAEHLSCAPGRYRFDAEELDSASFGRRLAELAARHPLSYLEDPFDPADEHAWRQLRARLPAATAMVGDDLFATNASRVRPGLADGIVLKLSQAGTVTATVDACRAARRAGLIVAVSHRSGETEDTAMCDLAVAVGADLIKVGGPRRGDRLAKYNQLLRLDELLGAGHLATEIHSEKLKEKS